MNFALGELSWGENNNDDSSKGNGKIQWQSYALPYANGEFISTRNSWVGHITISLEIEME